MTIIHQFVVNAWSKTKEPRNLVPCEVCRIAIQGCNRLNGLKNEVLKLNGVVAKEHYLVVHDVVSSKSQNIASLILKDIKPSRVILKNYLAINVESLVKIVGKI